MTDKKEIEEFMQRKINELPDKKDREHMRKIYEAVKEHTIPPKCPMCNKPMTLIEEESGVYNQTFQSDCDCDKKYPKSKGLKMSVG